MPIRTGVVTVDETIAVAFAAMKAAAIAMCRIEGDTIELLPSCTFAEIRKAMPADGPENPTALMLNSLLIPTAERSIDGTQSMRFAHRVFQEFFLASVIVEDRARFAGLLLPRPLQEWVDDLTV